jgi:hypothetical protein
VFWRRLRPPDVAPTRATTPARVAAAAAVATTVILVCTAHRSKSLLPVFFHFVVLLLLCFRVSLYLDNAVRTRVAVALFLFFCTASVGSFFNAVVLFLPF